MNRKQYVTYVNVAYSILFIDVAQKMYHFLSLLFLSLILYPSMLMLNLKNCPPLTCKIEGKTSNQQKQTTKANKKIGAIVGNTKC